MTISYQVERKLAVESPIKAKRRKALLFARKQRPPPPQPWVMVAFSATRAHPNAIGLVGSVYGEQVRLRLLGDGSIVDIYEWVPSMPVNPGDLACTEFRPGWRLIERHNSPVPVGGSDELAHFFQAG